MYKKILVLLLIFTLFLQWNGPVGAANDTLLESISSSGNQSNSFSYESMVSGNGRYLTFSSDANNLVNGDNNGITDVYIRDLEHNNTECISRSSSGSLIGGYSPSISGDGRYVTFTSMESGISSSQIFLRDRILNITKIISLNNVGDAADGDCGESSISGDGRFVAFTSWASNLVSGDNNGLSDIFIRDLILNTTKLVSIRVNGQQGNVESYTPSISFNGQFIAFVSSANNLINNDNNDAEDIFVKDMVSGVIKITSLNNNGEQANSYSSSPSISNDGTRVAFSSMADNLVAGDNNSRRDVFVRDLVYNITKRASESSLGEEVRMESSNPIISGDGRYVAFESGNRPPQVSAASPGHGWLYSTPKNQISQASALVPGDIIDSKDIFVKDLFTGDITKISWSVNGSEANGDSYEPSINYNGSVVSFTSWASDMTNNDHNEWGDIFANGVLVSNPEFKLNGYLTPLTLKAGQWVKVIASTSYPAKSVVALIKGVKINLSFLNGHWEGSYKVPAGEKVGKQNVNLMAYSFLANDSCLLSFNVISTPAKPSNPVIKPVVKPVIKKQTILNKIKSNIPIITKPIIVKVSKPVSTNKPVKATSTVKTASGADLVKIISNIVFPKNIGVERTLITPEYKRYVENLVKKKDYNSLAVEVYYWNIFNYVSYKSGEASKKAGKTGNFWDFWDKTMFHVYGYSNLDKTWGGGNIKWLLDGLAGVDEHGNVSVGNFLIDLIAIIPLARLASWGGKSLVKIVPNVVKNSNLYRKLLKLSNKFGLTQSNNLNNVYSVLTSVINLGPGVIVDIASRLVSKVLKSDNKATIALSNFASYQSKRAIGDIIGFIKAPDKVKFVKENALKTINNISRNFKYPVKSIAAKVKGLAKTVSKVVKGAAKSISKVTGKIKSTVKSTIKKAKTVIKTTAKTIKKKVIKYSKKAKTVYHKAKTYVKKAAKKVYHKAKKVYHKAKKYVKKVYHKAKSYVKKVYNKAKSYVKKAGKKIYNTVKNTYNGIKKFFRW
ncbi:MAG: hypothetical protein Q8N97_05510 [Methanobacteriaceae archaeon]|nr:hypothetical protein [Methanobacteriaceae archaeon]